jgi:hypothetical protein
VIQEMKLDRNLPSNEGRGKYALLLLRKLTAYEPADAFTSNPVMDAIALLDKEGLIDWGDLGSESEFFVMRLKDRHAEPGLRAYAQDAWLHGDEEWAREVVEMAGRAGPNHPACRLPD